LIADWMNASAERKAANVIHWSLEDRPVERAVEAAVKVSSIFARVDEYWPDGPDTMATMLQVEDGINLTDIDLFAYRSRHGRWELKIGTHGPNRLAATVFVSLLYLSKIGRLGSLRPHCRVCGRWYFARKSNHEDCSPKCRKKFLKDYHRDDMRKRRREDNDTETEPEAERRLNGEDKREALRRSAGPQRLYL
jgi:hypothetical protein